MGSVQASRSRKHRLSQDLASGQESTQSASHCPTAETMVFQPVIQTSEVISFIHLEHYHNSCDNSFCQHYEFALKSFFLMCYNWEAFMKWAEGERKRSKLLGMRSIQTGSDKSVSLLKGKLRLPRDQKLSSVRLLRVYMRKWNCLSWSHTEPFGRRYKGIQQLSIYSPIFFSTHQISGLFFLNLCQLSILLMALVPLTNLFVVLDAMA